MDHQIVTLIELGKLDLEISQISKTLDQGPEHIQILKKERDAAKSAFDEINQIYLSKNDELEELQKKVNLESASIKDKEARLHQIKTQKEFQAVTTEITETRRLINERETKILELMEEIEPLKAKNDELTRSLEERQAVLEKEQTEFSGEREELSNNLVQITDKRQTLEGQIDTGVLSKYRRIQNKLKPAIAKVVNGSCTLCSVQQLPQVINLLHEKKSLQTCSTCGRIIYLD